MLTTLEILREARQWLDDPSHWCSGAFLRHADGEVVASCAAGSYYAVAMRRGLRPTDERVWSINRTLHRIAQTMGYPTIHQLNDEGGYAKALELLNRGVTELEEQQSLFDRLEVEMAEFALA